MGYCALCNCLIRSLLPLSLGIPWLIQPVKHNEIILLSKCSLRMLSFKISLPCCEKTKQYGEATGGLSVKGLLLSAAFKPSQLRCQTLPLILNQIKTIQINTTEAPSIMEHGLDILLYTDFPNHDIYENNKMIEKFFLQSLRYLFMQ